MTRALRLEDLLLAGWNALGVPLVGASAVAPVLTLGEPPNPTAGIVQLAAVIGAIVAVGTRPGRAGLPAIGPSNARLALIGPFIGAVAFVAGSASSHLGMRIDGIVVGLAFVVIMAAATFSDRLPTVDAGLRRALVLPFIAVCAGIFDGFAAEVLVGVDVVELVASAAVDQTGFGIFVIGMLLAALAAFYAALVVAPRLMVGTESAPSALGCLIWPARFVLYIASAAFGIGWLVALGG